MQIVHMIVDRLHVGESNRGVIKYLVSKMACGLKTYKAMGKASRRAMIRQALARHAENRNTYNYVMGGGHGYTGR